MYCTMHCFNVHVQGTFNVIYIFTIHISSVIDEYTAISSDEYESRLFAELWYGEAHRSALGQNIKHK